MNLKIALSTLGLEYPANSFDEVKKAYRNLAKKYHPDHNSNDPQANHRFYEIKKAYDYILENFDSDLQQEETDEAPNPFKDDEPTNNPGVENITYDVPKSETLHLKYSLSLSLEEAANGFTKTIHYVRKDYHRNKETVRLAVKIPAGIRDGQKLRIKGEGSRNGVTPPGDLYVFINLKSHPLFIKEGRNIRMDLPISLSESLFGCEKTIPTLYGKSKVTLPPKTVSGKTLRLKHKGFPRVNGYGKGDFLIRVLIDVPTDLNTEERSWLEKISKKASPLIREYELALTKIKG